MGNKMDAEGANSHSRPQILIIADSDRKSAGASQSQVESTPLIELPIYLLQEDKGVIQPLNVPARNAIAHKSPALVMHAVAEAFQRRANKEGFYEGTDCVVRWKPSVIPFHIEFEMSVSNRTCQHLASVRKIKAEDPYQYAKNIVPLAKIFLSKPPGSQLPHMPFTQPQVPIETRPNRNSEDKRTTQTIAHARHICTQYNSLTEIDIKTAEATAIMVNAGKIFSGLLVYLTSPRSRNEDAVISTKPRTTGDKGSQPTERPFLPAPKRVKPLLSADELQGLGPVLKHKRVVSNPEISIDGGMCTEKPGLGENIAPEDTSAMGRTLPEEPASAIRSSKEGKASKKNNQGGKNILEKQTRNGTTSTVSAYPTQRPARKKPARNSFTTRESSQRKRLGPEERDLEQVSATRSPTIGWSDHKQNTPEQRLLLAESSQEDRAFLKSASEEHEEFESHTAKEVLDLNRMATDVKSSPFDVIHREDLITSADKPIVFSLPTKPIQMYGSGVQGLLLAYATNPKVDETLNDAGVWLWRKPKTHYCTQPLLQMEKFGHTVLAPVVVSRKRTGDDEPLVEFDGVVVHIVPHEQCWRDVRSHESHPDFLVPWKLAEYQASESAGYQVWRHDRELLQCRKPGCDATVSDYHPSTVICLGCGPKSVIRYCSLQHQSEDIEGHWKECGTWRVLLQRVIDHTTSPSKFVAMCPSIKQRYGSRTAALHRQTLYCGLTYGHYTLFDSFSNRSETLFWHKEDPKWPEMDQRVERVLNVAFFDSWNHYVLGYLYRLLRELLRSRGKWSESTEQVLKLQFEAEFSDYKVNTKWNNGDAPCQCEWSGKILPRYDHSSTCRNYAPTAADHGPVWRRNCIKATVEDYEERFWILRAWRQQHPTQNNWRLRAAGYGFAEMIPDEGCYELGPGWTGWGGDQDNVCEDLGVDQGEKRT